MRRRMAWKRGSGRNRPSRTPLQTRTWPLLGGGGGGGGSRVDQGAHTALAYARGGVFWDGRAASLEEQAIGPIANPI